jgi:AAA ATPase-like protein
VITDRPPVRMGHTGVVGEVLCPLLVGRQAEVRALESALAGALAGQGGCAVITGEVGIGKSRLIRELATMAADRQVPVVMGQPLLFAVSLRTEPLSPASDLARRQRGRPGLLHLPLGRLSDREVADMIAACAPGADNLDRAFAAHGITNVGPAMEQAEAERLLDQLAGAAAST